MTAPDAEEVDVEAALADLGFDPNASVLTRRQASVLLLRERGLTQAAIADRLGTSRANVANVEASARENIEKAEATVRFVDALDAPVRVTVPAGTDIYELPDRVYEACNAADIKVAYSAPELMKRVLTEADSVVHGRTIEAALLIHVDEAGEVGIERRKSR